MITYLEYLKLVEEVSRLRTQVHLFNFEEISEQVLDDLKHKITIFEEKNPDKISVNSPNYKVSGGISEGFKKYKHKKRMLSLNDIFTLKELKDWQGRWQKYLEKNQLDFNLKYAQKECSYITEPKIDGLALSLHYSSGQLIKAVTRGDGFEGEDVTQNALQILSIPKKINDLRVLEVRGEVFLTRSDFEILNKEILHGHKTGLAGKTGSEGQFANSRNAAAGTLRQLDSSIVAQRQLSFIAYNLFYYTLQPPNFD